MCCSTQLARRSLFSRLAWRKARTKFAWSAIGRSASSCERSRRQPRPMRLSSSAASGGLACASQRRGVTPLVLLLKRSGKSLAKSAKMDCFISSECRADTPLTEWLASTAT